ncbi:MAG TPA: hypothetical protein VMB05_04535 [Solirubrobacteraceae bacterium]|nr:hypothetical protein [Solirubrobacteraceae bacterium]
MAPAANVHAAERTIRNVQQPPGASQRVAPQARHATGEGLRFGLCFARARFEFSLFSPGSLGFHFCPLCGFSFQRFGSRTFFRVHLRNFAFALFDCFPRLLVREFFVFFRDFDRVGAGARAEEQRQQGQDNEHSQEPHRRELTHASA